MSAIKHTALLLVVFGLLSSSVIYITFWIKYPYYERIYIQSYLDIWMCMHVNDFMLIFSVSRKKTFLFVYGSFYSQLSSQ